MAGAPEPSGWEKVIRSVSSMKTRSALAALVFVLLFFMFWITLFLTKDLLQWVLSILILVIFGIFAYLAVCKTDITLRTDLSRLAPEKSLDELGIQAKRALTNRNRKGSAK